MAPFGLSDHLIDRFRRDLDRLAGIEPKRIGVALSGGPDSLSLLLLCSATKHDAVSAATVDHGLRAESADETAYAADVCKKLGIPHRILRVTVEPKASLQANARKARYDALRRWAEEESIPIILTGHHADDQAETLMMRLSRGSGVAGLAGVRPRTALSSAIQVCRPLLTWRRRELGSIVEAAGIRAIQDPSNENEHFDRVRMRKNLAQASWIDPMALARSAAALSDADEALDFATHMLASERLEIDAGRAVLDPHGVPAGLLRRLVQRALAHVAPGASPRGEQLTALIAALAADESVTLAGALCRGGTRWRFVPEPPRRPKA
jgi:tRNA(Ile)-lysidine synthase